MTALAVPPVLSPADRLAALERDLADPAKAEFRAEILAAIAHIEAQMRVASILEA